MKLFHLSDLHLGKRVNEFSMIEEQRHILAAVLAYSDEERPDGIIIAGDVYDKPLPPVEAVQLFDEFLVQLSQRKMHVFVISGNHDSPERIAFGGRLMEESGIHMAPVYSGTLTAVTLADAYGEVDICMLPFVKPASVRRFFPDREIVSYTDAVRCALEEKTENTERRRILITHQFVTGASRSDSEEISVGGTDNVDASVFDGFDYVALGHIHSPQNCGADHIRYCGTPLKYSFSEEKDRKSVTVVTLEEKGNVDIRTLPLVPLRDMCTLRGSYDALMQRDFYENTAYGENYMRIILTDEEDVPDAAAKLRTVYHNLMKLEYDNSRTRVGMEFVSVEEAEGKTPLELFAELYESQNGHPMTEGQTAFIKALMEEIWEDEVCG